MLVTFLKEYSVGLPPGSLVKHLGFSLRVKTEKQTLLPALWLSGKATALWVSMPLSDSSSV